MWAYTLFLPSFLENNPTGLLLLQHGPFGIEALRPQALFGADLPPLMHGVLWSLSLNLLTYVVMSLAHRPSSIERLQADLFVPSGADADRADLPALADHRYRAGYPEHGGAISRSRSRTPFVRSLCRQQSTFISIRPTPADFELLQHAERLIASSIGAASSRLVMSLLLRKRTVSAKAALKLLDDSHAALHFNREILQTALNHVRQGIAVFDADLQLICSNRQFGEILGAAAATDPDRRFPCRKCWNSWQPSTLPASATPTALLEKRLAAYTSDGAPYLERLPDRHMVIEVRSNRMPGGGLVITFTDVTPSFEAAEALERSNATLEKRVRDRTEELTRLNSELAQAKSTAEDANISKTRFLAAASHDILQPLNAARLYVTSLVERANSSGEISRLVENIDNSLEAIEEILGALLDISRLDAGVDDAVDHEFQGRRPDAIAGNRIYADGAGQGAGTEIRALFAAGAIRSAAAAPAAAEPDLQRHQIYPARTRAGRLPAPRPIAADWRLRHRRRHSRAKRGEIFKEFHRLEQGARIARGLGLGLSIVERLARVLNHGIALGTNAGGGSFFSVTVPIAQAINFTAALTSATPLSRTPMTGSLIVCIENDAAILDGMKTLLTAWCAEVIAVADPDRRDRGDRSRRRRGDRFPGRLPSRSRQWHCRDPGPPPPLRREHSGDPDHRRSQPACARRRAGRKHRGAQQAGQTGIAARAARTMAHPADGGRGMRRG